MEVNDELALYNHVDLFFSPPGPNNQDKNQQRRNQGECSAAVTTPKKMERKWDGKRRQPKVGTFSNKSNVLIFIRKVFRSGELHLAVKKA